MNLVPGTKLGPYEIVARIGAGGMGEVWKARDTRLNRIVAIKKGLGRFSERFEREAHAIAALNHPNICSLYDVGEDYLVMEYVEGKPLTGPLPLDEALTCARQILDALDAAHRKDIVHRDLKPGNILITKNGVKLLDFGLAKTGPAVAAEMATVNVPLTGTGTILGTLQYMSPEQLEGRETDARSDIFAFGLVLYELITGRHAFEGASQASLVASILKDQPQAVHELVPVTPAAIDRVLQTCLEKDPDKRWQTREVRHALDWVALAVPAAVPAPAARNAFNSWNVGAAVLLAIVATATATGWALRAKPLIAPEPMRFQIPAPEGATFETYVALSADGRRLAFTAFGSDGVVRIWVRDLKSLESRVLSGTEDAGSLFWSPDGRFVAFGYRNQLRKIDAAGGPALTLCDVPFTVGSGAWNDHGIIVFGGRGIGQLRQVSDAGGVATVVTAVDPSRGETFHSLPSFLPDGRHFLYLRWGGTVDSSGVFVGSLDAKPEQQSLERLIPGLYGATYTYAQTAGNGRVLFMRNGSLMAQAFDADRLRFAGDPVLVADRVGIVNVLGVFAVSRSGTLVYRVGNFAAGRALAWFDREGSRRVQARSSVRTRICRCHQTGCGQRSAVAPISPPNSGCTISAAM